MEYVEEHVSDGRVLELIEVYRHQDIVKDMDKCRPRGRGRRKPFPPPIGCDLE